MSLQIDKGNRTARWTVAIRGTRTVRGVTQVVAFNSIRSSALDGFEPSSIADCLSGKQKTHAGYTWERVAQQQPKEKGPCRLRQVAHLRNALHRTPEEMADLMGLSVGRVHGLVKEANKAGLILHTGHEIRRLRREAGTL